MKRRYSPEARRAHLRAMHQATVQQVAVLPTLPVDEVVRQGEALIENYKQGFLTMLELGQLLNELFAREQPKPDPKPEEDDDGLPLPAPKPEIELCRQCGKEPVYAAGLCAGCYQTWYKQQEVSQHLHAEDCQCHLCWAASLTPPSPPWEAPETIYCDTPECPNIVTKSGYCTDCEAQHAAFDNEHQERYQSVTYYPESDITVCIGEETPFDPSHWPPEIVEQHKNCGPECPVHRPPWEGGAA